MSVCFIFSLAAMRPKQTTINCCFNSLDVIATVSNLAESDSILFLLSDFASTRTIKTHLSTVIDTCANKICWVFFIFFFFFYFFVFHTTSQTQQKFSCESLLFNLGSLFGIRIQIIRALSGNFVISHFESKHTKDICTYWSVFYHTMDKYLHLTYFFYFFFFEQMVCGWRIEQNSNNWLESDLVYEYYKSHVH